MLSPFEVKWRNLYMYTLSLRHIYRIFNIIKILAKFFNEIKDQYHWSACSILKSEYWNNNIHTRRGEIKFGWQKLRRNFRKSGPWFEFSVNNTHLHKEKIQRTCTIFFEMWSVETQYLHYELWKKQLFRIQLLHHIIISSSLSYKCMYDKELGILFYHFIYLGE